MTLRDYWIVIRKGWLAMLILTILGGGAAVGATFLMTPLYASTTTVFVSAQTATTASDLLQGSSFTQQRVKSYADIATSPLVLEPVIQTLRLRATAETLAKEITVDNPLNTVLINVTVLNPDPRLAAEIANAVGQSLADQVNNIEAPIVGQSSPVKLSTVALGAVASTPDSPKPILNVALGLLAGLLLGFGLSLAREIMDTRIRNGNDIEDINPSGILGGIAYDPDATQNPLVFISKPKSNRAESFRQLRTNIQFIQAANESNSIVITSSVPFEGKSITIANLALSLADAGQRVLLIDCDFRKPKVHKIFGISGAVGLTNMLIGKAAWNDIVQPYGKLGRLDLVPAGSLPPNPSELLSSDNMKKLISQVEAKYDIVLVDTPPLLPVTDAAVLSTICGGVIMVVSMSATTKPQLQGAVNHIESVKGRLFGFVMNKIPIKGADSYYYNSNGYKYGYKYGSYGTQYTYEKHLNQRQEKKQNKINSFVEKALKRVKS